MTSRERVIAAFNHQKADRCPRYEVFLDGYVENWRAATGKSDSADFYEIYYDYPKIDIGTVWGFQEGPFRSRVRREELGGGKYLQMDSWGRVQRCSHNGIFYQVVETVLDDKSNLDKLVFEDPWTPETAGYFTSGSTQFSDRSVPVGGVMGLFMPSYYLRGEFNLLMDLVEDVPFCRALAERLVDFLVPEAEKCLEATNTYDTAFWLYDELGNNKSSIISPDTFEAVYLEPYKKLISAIKAKGASKIILHCDGNCLPLLDLLIEAGFDGVQGVNPTAGMTVPEVKNKYGNKLILIGGMCNILVIPSGDEKRIETQARSILEVARDGGVIIGTHSIDSDISVENYNKYYQIMEKLDNEW
jgi:uroporphyrinogen decarboxylase